MIHNFKLPTLFQGLLLTLLAIVFAIPTSAETRITSVDHYRLPPGETITLTGIGLSDITRARFQNIIEAEFASVNDTTVKITMPDFASGTAAYTLLLETESGSTVSIPTGSYIEHTTAGAPNNPSYRGGIVIRSGATLTGEIKASTIVIEAGGVFEMHPQSSTAQIYAEDGAFVNVSSARTNYSKVYYSPDTVIIGDLPRDIWGKSNHEQLTSITPSYEIDRFSLGAELNIEIVGNGTVETYFDYDYYPYNGSERLTAIPAPGYMFSGWSGDRSSIEETLLIQLSDVPPAIKATFSPGWLLDLPTINGASVHVSPERDLYSDGEEVTLTATVAPGYEFLGWGGDSSGDQLSTTITLNANKTTFPMVRPLNYANLPQLIDADQYVNAIGDTMTIDGTSLENAISALLIHEDDQIPATVTQINSMKIGLLMPEVPNPKYSAYHLLLNTATGSTLTLPSNFQEHTPDGIVLNPGIKDPVVVRAGATVHGTSHTELAIVEAGGYYRVDDSHGTADVIIAEDGAVIDFRSVTSPMALLFFYSPNTVILGTVPANPYTTGPASIPIQPFKTSYEFPSIQAGVPVNLNITGNGTVQFTPDQKNYAYGSVVTIQALPPTGATFNNWSGDINSSQETISHSFKTTPLNLNAHFSTRWNLDTPNIPNATVTRSPNLPLYENDQSVTLSLTVAAGYEFHGWAGDASGSTLTTDLVMNGNKRAVPIIRPSDYDTLPQITGASYPVIAYNKTQTIYGSNLASANKATLLYATNYVSRSVTNIQEDSLQFTMPYFSTNPHTAHYLFLESLTGSTIGVPSFNEHTTIGESPYHNQHAPMVVRAGATLLGDVSSRLIIVESGGTLRLDFRNPLYNSKHVFAEDGAIIDFSEATQSRTIAYHCSPSSLIIGSPHDGASINQHTHIRASYGMPTITKGYEVTVTVDGPGEVQISPDQLYHKYHSNVHLTATPDADAYFIRWTGSHSEIDPTSSFTVKGASDVNAKFSTATNYFSVWRLEHFTNEELEDRAISAFDADPDRDSLSNSAEYAFGSDPRSSNKKRKIKVDKKRVDGAFTFTVSYPRPVNSLDVTYQILVSKDLVTWNFNGDDTDLVYSEEISVESIDEDTEEVTSILYPNNDSPKTFFVKISALLFE